jgi:hypothetical protein
MMFVSSLAAIMISSAKAKGVSATSNAAAPAATANQPIHVRHCIRLLPLTIAHRRLQHRKIAA